MKEASREPAPLSTPRYGLPGDPAPARIVNADFNLPLLADEIMPVFVPV